MFSNEITKGAKKNGNFSFVRTGRNYQEFTDFYEQLYNQYIPYAVKNGVRVTHFHRDGATANEKRELIAFVLEKILRVHNTKSFELRIVREMHAQAYVSDIYHTNNSGNIMALTHASLGEPSLAVWGARTTSLFDKYFSFLTSHSEARVGFFPESERRKFFATYSDMASFGPRVMLQKTPANATRPIADFADENTTWAKRTKFIETERGGPSINLMLSLRRRMATNFRDSLLRLRQPFRQIMSRSAVASWVRSVV